jgi:hypothetical protein
MLVYKCFDTIQQKLLVSLIKENSGESKGTKNQFLHLDIVATVHPDQYYRERV